MDAHEQLNESSRQNNRVLNGSKLQNVNKSNARSYAQWTIGTILSLGANKPSHTDRLNCAHNGENLPDFEIIRSVLLRLKTDLPLNLLVTI